MQKTAIVTDTNSGISAAQAKEMGVSLIPMPFFMDGVPCLEGREYTPEAFFDKLRAGADVSTSQPSPSVMTDLWDELLKDHDRVLHFPMSSSLSGTCQTAKALAEDYDGRVLVVDDRRISIQLLQSVRNAQTLLAQGKTAEEVRDLLEAESLEANAYIAVNTLKYLKKSGRVTAAGAAMASVLQIKPVLQVQGGKLDAFKKARGLAQAKKIMISAMKEELQGCFAGREMTLFAVYSGSPEQGEAWHKEVQAAFPERPVELWALPLSICCHVGDGALAIACAKRW